MRQENMPLIDNRNQTLQQALKNTLTTAKQIDIAVGFFYFSGFQALAQELKDKKVRILVGLEVDPGLIPQIAQLAKEGDEDLSRWQPRRPTTSRTLLKQNYIDALIGFMNDTDIFDSKQSSNTYDLYLEKIKNGTLEIRKTVKDYHGKFYLVYNKPEVSQNGDFPGTAFMGSSNLTYKGLIGQGELNDSYRDKAKFIDYQKEFEEMWDESKSIAIADIQTKEEFLKNVSARIWKNNIPKPYYIYIRVLHELFSQENIEKLLTPNKITKGIYMDLEYQIDAVKMSIDKLQKYDGMILADVVGLGKSIIAATVGRNLDMNTVIIVPPHIMSQWEDYKEQFGIRGSRVFSSGNIKEVYERYHETQIPILFILDEAHWYRNEDTNDYKMLHQICRSHPENKILILSATPFNNDPKDVFALLKLFQTPGETTIRSVDNLSLRYRDLIQRYKKLRRGMAKDELKPEEINIEASEIASEQRRLIEPIVIRRSRLDLLGITRYREDLERQKVEFAEIRGPELLEYKLGDLTSLYLETLDLITKPDKEGFLGARYKPTTYMSEEGRKKFVEKYKNELGDETDLTTAQTNLAAFMRRLLVLRFESSKDAFRISLEKMIKSNQLIEHWWDDLGRVPIMKKGQLPDPRDYYEEDGENADQLSDDLEMLRNEKGLLEIDKEMMDNPNFIKDVKHDTELLITVKNKWYTDSQFSQIDPKLENIARKIQSFLKERPDRKIVIFSSYKDTVEYLYKKLLEFGLQRVIKYTASEPTAIKKEVQANFDASISSNKQKGDYDILVATDALSEGSNLHRAGIIINYDIPYNPTRVIQRVGRINRINKKVFDYLYIFNCFPTDIGEAETHIKSISTLKIKLFNAIMGSDTKALTKDEELLSFFKDQFESLVKESESVSWDTPHREAYDKALVDKDLMEAVKAVPHRSKIKRVDTDKKGVAVFGKKGDHSIFTFGESTDNVGIISAQDVLPFFSAKVVDQAQPVDNGFINVFNLAKEKLFAKHELPKVLGRRSDAINVLKVIANSLPNSKDYCEDVINIIKTLDDLSEGTLKDIAQLDLRNIEAAYEELLKLVPVNFIRNVLNRAERSQDEQELLLFAEQLQ